MGTSSSKSYAQWSFETKRRSFVLNRRNQYKTWLGRNYRLKNQIGSMTVRSMANEEYRKSKNIYTRPIKRPYYVNTQYAQIKRMNK